MFMEVIKNKRPDLKIWDETKSGSFGIINPMPDRAKEELHHLKRRSEEFHKVFNKLLLPLRYAVLSLLSWNKVTPFSTKLI